MNARPADVMTVSTRRALMFACTATVLLLGAGLLSGCGNKNTSAAGPPPPMPVTVVKVQQTDVPLTGEWVGTLDGYVNAQIQPQVSGYLIKQNYKEGALVSKGQVLFEIDPRPFQAALDQAKGQLAQAKGQVQQAQAQLQLAEINVNRDTPLAEARAIAQSQLDKAKVGVPLIALARFKFPTYDPTKLPSHRLKLPSLPHRPRSRMRN